MTWEDAAKIVTLIMASFGGGAIVLRGLMKFLGDIQLQRFAGDINAKLQQMKGDIDAKLQRLDAALEHKNYLLQRFAEYELEAIVECWRAARACLPLLNAMRPVDSGTDEEILKSNRKPSGKRTTPFSWQWDVTSHSCRMT